MLGILIMIACAFGGAIMYLIALQIGYLLGKRKAENDKEDRYWDMCRQIAHYDDELYNGSYIVMKEVDKNVPLKDIVHTKYSDVGDPYEDGGL